SRVIATQTSNAWVPLTHNCKALEDGNFIWSSEETGWQHLYLYNKDGRRLRAITRGEYPVKSLNGVSQDTGEVVFTTSMRDGKELPIEQQLFKASLKRTVTPTEITPRGGWWSASVNGTGTAYVGNYSDLNTPSQSALYTIDGNRVRWIEENKLQPGHPFWPFAERQQKPTFGTLESHGETLVWQMSTPPNFDPTKKYPVVMQVYGGPSAGGVKR